ncbi:MAG: hypothetical protein HXY49_07005 [Ignavibacteriaceae bacterium]|nr:hypothetical protein [Ignavibacteriaceae bacterium]
MRAKKIYRFAIIIAILFCGVIFYSCQNAGDQLVTDEIQFEEYVPTAADIKSETERIINDMFKMSSNSLTYYDKLMAAYNLIQKPADWSDSIIYRYENGFHIWEGEITDAENPDSYNGSYLRKMQFKDVLNGNIIENPELADFMGYLITLEGKYGFVNGSPMGDHLKESLQGQWVGLLSQPVFNGTGFYQRKWRGQWSRDGEVYRNMQVNYRVDITINNMLLNLSPDDYSLTGDILLSMPPYNAIARCNNSKIAIVDVYKEGSYMMTFEMLIPNLYGFDFGLGL